MEEISQVPAPPGTDELIQLCGEQINKVMSEEMSDEADPDRVWILRNIHKNYLYYRDLQQFAPALYQGLVDSTGIAGSTLPDEVGSGLYDYTQNVYRGYCRKLEAVLGGRMPNAIAVPDNPDDDDAARSTRSANSAALYARDKCDLQLQMIYLVFGLFNFGTMFWHVDMVEDPDNPKTVPTMEQEQQTLGDAAFICPNCSAAQPADPATPPPTTCPQCGAPMGPENFKPPTQAMVPKPGVKQVPGHKLDISLHDASEVSVPLDSKSTEDCDWLRYSRERHKAKCISKWGDKVKKSPDSRDVEETVSEQYAESIRSAMGSPIGLVRSKRVNRWTVCDTWWTVAMFELVDDEGVRDLLKQNFKDGLRITSVRGRIVDLQNEKLSDHWQECKPEPAQRIMADPLGNDWTEVQDILNNTLNQAQETLERSNEPGFGDPTRIDFDAYQNRRDNPGELFPALRPAGGSLSDIIYRPDPLVFSDQLVPFSMSVEARGKNISGIEDPIFGGGDAEEPTARQAELKKNAAMMQLGVPWTFIGKSLEHVYMKTCRLLSQYEDGILSFSKKNQFGRYNTMSVVIEDLRNGKYHFEADEAIPMTWGQQRDLMMWMLDKPAPLLHQWGMDDPMNIFEFKQLLGMPGERTPLLDDREKGLDVISQLLQSAPTAGPPGPPDPATGQPTAGPPQSSIQPDWEDDHAFCSMLAKAYLQANPDLKKEVPDGYLNVQLWGQAHEAMANQPVAPTPPKTSLAVSLKGPDLGDPAVQDALTKSGIVSQGTPVQAVPQAPPGMNGIMPPPGTAPAPPSGPPQ